MTEAKEKKQTGFESGWAVSYDEVFPPGLMGCHAGLQEEHRAWLMLMSPSLALTDNPTAEK